MPDRPLLILPSPDLPAARRKKHGGGGNVERPTRFRQDERMSPKFTVLRHALETRSARVQTETTGIVPEEVIVFETIQPIEEFAQAVNRIDGLEWLGEIEEEDIPPDDDFFVKDEEGARKEGKTFRGRLFLIFTNQQALNQIISLWDLWKEGKQLDPGLAKWANVFSLLRDVRPWSVVDRLRETGVLEDWRERVEQNEEIVPCEVELWFRQNPQRRQSARDRVASALKSLEGNIHTEKIIEEIGYHGLLLRLPIAAVASIISTTGDDTDLIHCEQIQFFRACGQMSGIITDGPRAPDTPLTMPAAGLGDPVVALFDGLPIQNHQRLFGRIVVDDPDNLEAEYPAQERRHGTAMASLILHGDLDNGEEPISRRLYVRPILRPDPLDWRQPRREVVAETTLIVDLIYRAVMRLFEQQGEEEPVAPQVCVINLSVGIRDRQFVGTLSPLARLLDWLAWKYRVLFIVSAGNHTHDVELAVLRGQFATLTPQDLQSEIIKAVAADARNRRLLSPAEAVNVLTIGAQHKDASPDGPPPNCILPFVDSGLPSPINAQGMGYRRAIKPDILMPGGRLFYRENLATSNNFILQVMELNHPPGQRVAAPGAIAGDLTSSWHIRGTSNSAAIASRSASVLFDMLQELLTEPGGQMITSVPYAVWLKALLVHAASWGTASDTLESILRTAGNSRRFKEYLTRLLGYGISDPDAVRECTPHRVTALGGGHLEADKAHIHRFPLPPSLSGLRGYRRLTVTLAWITPINIMHQAWRRADLWFHPDPTRQPHDHGHLTKLGLDREESDTRVAQRGTVQHEVLGGNRAAAFVDGDNVDIQVSCRADAGVQEESIPYAIAVTLEISPKIEIDIYNEIKARVHARVQVTQATQT